MRKRGGPPRTGSLMCFRRDDSGAVNEGPKGNDRMGMVSSTDVNSGFVGTNFLNQGPLQVTNKMVSM